MLTTDGLTLTAPTAPAGASTTTSLQPTETPTTMNPLILNSIINGIALAPTIVAGIEQIHSDASGATKLQLATESLQLATGTAAAVLPADQGAIAQTVGSAFESIINSMVAVFNSTGLFSHKAAAPAVAAAATAGVV